MQVMDYWSNANHRITKSHLTQPAFRMGCPWRPVVTLPLKAILG